MASRGYRERQECGNGEVDGAIPSPCSVVITSIPLVARTFPDLLTDEGLSLVAGYASGISPWKRYIVSTTGVDADKDGNADDVNADGVVNDADRTAVAAGDFIARAHAKGLFVHTWTFRSEAIFLASDYAADPTNEYEVFYNLGIDGVFSDFPDVAVKARDAVEP